MNLDWLAIVLLPITLIRTLRWLAIIQQKEYRLDRLELFLKSEEGRKEIWLLWPFTNRPSWPQVKRPKITSRVLFCLTFHLLLTLMVYSVTHSIVVSILLLTGFTPVFIITAMLPSILIAELVTLYTLKKAQAKVRKHQPTIIGLTGSYGKTSTKYLLAHILKSQYKVFVTPKSYNTRYSVAKSILSQYQGEPYMILEYGAYTKNEIKQLASWFKPQLAVITGITPQHLGLFGSLQAIKQAKVELIKALDDHNMVFFHAADPQVADMCQPYAHKAHPYTGPLAPIQLKKTQLDSQGKLSFTWDNHTVKTQLVGKHYLANIQGAMSVCTHLGMTKAQIIQALTNFLPGDNFIQSYVLPSGCLVVDDGKTANVTGFMSAMSLVKELPAKRKILLFSGIIDLGEQSGALHTELAQAAKSLFAEVWYLGEEGKQEFKNYFYHNMYVDVKIIVQKIQALDSQSLLLIEGKIPQIVLEHLCP